MQSVAMRRVAVQSTIRARPMMMARSFALSPYRLDEAPVKPDAAADSLKRGAKNVAGAVGKAARAVKNTVADFGTATKEIFADGRVEGKESAVHAKEMVKKRISKQPAADPAIKSP